MCSNSRKNEGKKNAFCSNFKRLVKREEFSKNRITNEEKFIMKLICQQLNELTSSSFKMLKSTLELIVKD